ncbi:iron-siderophore ABC transporter substrate-binding protein [Vreelandella subglaciescola]|jgi:iron complex transport system substrate-binding protein|uniref:Iron complex transport system substrate-binding protein n=1 Tax=Vreelandella subglaciescola TaxID=29571 RepID=A0A1M7GYQ7_9GAMM|nr:iron-siderophore ABC transporter substrate-binding protein [Halomonas subglaciescola]SHM21246.1 iron complex transport system substrate-binding protein [Halomonas subglaciescola]
MSALQWLHQDAHTLTPASLCRLGQRLGALPCTCWTRKLFLLMPYIRFPLAARLALSAALSLTPFFALQASAAETPPATPRFATLDWTIAETLLALDAPLRGVAQADAYGDWVKTPVIPPSTADLGLRAQPNLERLAALAPERIFISPLFANLEPRLSRLSPVTTLPLYQPGTDTWQAMQTLTHRLGEHTHRRDEAQALINDTQALMAALRTTLPATRPLLMVQFIDARHVRVFGKNGLYQAVLKQLGIANAWQQPTNAWGFSTVGIEALAEHADARLVVVKPLPSGVKPALAQSGLWHHLPSVKRDDVIMLPPAWSFGALPSAQRFARLLSDALTTPTAIQRRLSSGR